MRTQTQGKTSYPDMSSRQNPQFKQTAIKYLNQKKQRKQLDKRKHLVSNQVKHYKKLNDSLQKQLSQKQHELQWMRQVRQRYMSSIQGKKDRDQQQRRKLQQLKTYNTTIRQKSIQNIHDALNQLHRKKSRAHDQLTKNMEQLKKRYNLKKQQMEEANHGLFMDVRKSRVRCKNRVNKFFQKKSTDLTRFYKSMASNEQQAYVTGVKQIEQLHTKESKYKTKVANKQQRMSHVLDRIQQLKKSSQQIANAAMRSSRYEGGMMRMNGSKVSRTERTENETEERHSVGFRMMNVGSTQFINDGEEVI